MLDAPLASLYAVFLAVAVLFAAAAPREDRRGAVLLAVLLAVNWFCFLLTYTPYSPARAMGIRPQDWWALMDGICGVAAVVAFARWWGWALWLAAMVQEIIHAGCDFGWYDQYAYTDYLDFVLRAQIALFFLIGGRGVWDLLHRGIARLRRPRWPRAAGYARTSSRGAPE